MLQWTHLLFLNVTYCFHLVHSNKVHRTYSRTYSRTMHPVHKHVYVVFIQLLVAWWLTHFSNKTINRSKKQGIRQGHRRSSGPRQMDVCRYILSCWPISGTKIVDPFKLEFLAFWQLIVLNKIIQVNVLRQGFCSQESFEIICS